MSDKSKKLELGFHNVEFTNPSKESSYQKGDKAVYHSSTAQNLLDKGWLKSLGKVKTYFPKTARK